MRKGWTPFRQQRVRRRFRRWWGLLALLVLLSALAVRIFVRCRPIIREFAESTALWTAAQIANDTVAEVLVDHSDLCRSLVQVNYNDRQILSSVTVDSASVNTIKTAVTATVMRRIEDLDRIPVEIPFGTLFGPQWISGWGPLVILPISMTPNVVSGVSSSLKAVGINQSIYEVQVDVDISLYVVTPGGRSTVKTTVSLPMAQSVILGEVPGALTEVYGDTQDTTGRVFDYGADR